MTQTEISQSRTPKEIVEELDKYIIGQNAAKRAVAIALRNRWRRQSVKTDIRDEIMPNNIIMIGPTGVGKTEIARRLAKLAGAPFVKVEATKFTEVGYVGRDVESIVRDLAEAAVNMVRAEKSAEVQIQAKNAAINRVLDALIPPLKRGPSFDTASDEDIEMNSKTRDKFREMILDGALNERQIEIDITVDPSSSLHVLGPMGMDEMTSNIQEMLGSMMPKKSKTRKVTVAEALVLCEKEESEKLIDMDKVTREAIRRAENTGIVFIDEIDKVASRSGDGHGPSVSREGVQRDLLPIVEGSAVNTKHGVVKTDHVLFIASGAFHVSKPSDLIPELQGRFPIRVELQSLTEEDFINILTVPQNALIKQYKALLETENIVLEFDPSAIKEIAATAARVNDDVANIGARRLHTILTTLLDEIMFDATAATMSHQTITIDDSYVKDKLSQIAGNTDVSKYIL
ncbi:MAG TPA: ATP-dependent protease ATPase subunit HslU [Candidatus Kapabacteria bacterium]|jgi:ATP-dependent HslUV protease ATP-binding subunit HslU|nr:ATP-dependent protease ATPase subunit HslU [Ignavibacteria bacterium]HRE57513.1 ATP-dependent protease ATPase subunit HslU [Candidatus Kapabacteria bacterium]HRK58769.1 ATP-dependent protease ATPase subunit HslU [Candidatus Kapabacteria bacterium]